MRFTVKNVSAAPLSIWSRSCSWGHEVVTFQVTRADGGGFELYEAPLAWRKNVPTGHELTPGAEFALDLGLTKMVRRSGYI